MPEQATTTHPYDLRARTAKSLLQRLYRDGSTLIAEEVDLVKAEGRQRGAILMTALRTFAFALALALVALLCLATCMVAGLTNVMSVWLAALIVAVAFAVVAAALKGVAGRAVRRAGEPALSKLSVMLEPVDAAETLGERRARIEWTRRQVDETLSALAHKTDLGPPLRDTAFGLGSFGVAVSAIMRDGKHDR